MPGKVEAVLKSYLKLCVAYLVEMMHSFSERLVSSRQAEVTCGLYVLIIIIISFRGIMYVYLFVVRGVVRLGKMSNTAELEITTKNWCLSSLSREKPLRTFNMTCLSPFHV